MGEEMEHHYMDEEDDRQFSKMYPESCKRIMPYVKEEIDRMEEKDEMMHDDQPDREMVNMMTDNAYNRMVKEMPEMAEEEETRQYPIRRFTRDLLGILLINELLRRRRRRRYYNPYGGYGYDYDYDYYDYF
jgi:glutamyl-tRNA reductase